MNIGAPRAIVEGSKFAGKLMIPYTKMLKNGKYVQADVISIGGERAIIRRPGANTTEDISFDFGIIALGSSYNAPIKAVSRSTLDTVAALDMIHHKLKSAKGVAIVGGGPVGVEIAAEIKTDFPALAVTIVHGGQSLLNGAGNHSTAKPLPAAFVNAVTTKLTDVGVVVALGQRAIIPPSHEPSRGFILEPTLLKTDKGLTFDVDVVLFATGAVVNNAPLKQYLSSVLNEAGEVKVTPTLNVEGFPHLFAIGDCAAIGDGKQAYVTAAQAKHVRKVITAQLAGRTTPLYKVRPGAIIVTLGRKHGAGLLPNGWILGDMPVRTIKGKDYFVGMKRGQMHSPLAS